jgi:predicted MFS family arabinose efflux permease
VGAVQRDRSVHRRLLTDRLSWHWVFFVNMPIGAVAIAFVILKMPRLGGAGARGRLDVTGALALVLAVVPLLLALSLGGAAAAGRGGGLAWSSPAVLALLATSGVGLVLFLLLERHASDPILDLRLFRNRVFAVGNAAVFVVGATFFAGIVFLPLFMVNVVGLSATRSGATLTPLTLAVVAGNVLSGQLVARFGRYRPLMLGALVILASAFALLGFTLSTESTQAWVTLKMVLVGLGLGPSIPLYTLAIQNAVAPQQIGVATASATFFRQIGATIGVALLGTAFSTRLAHELARAGALGAAATMPGPDGRLSLAARAAFAAATREVYRLGLILVVVALVLTAVLPELPLRRTNR